MKIRTTITTLALAMVTLVVTAGEYCTKTVVYFDFGRYNLKKEARTELSNLVKSITKEDEFLVELSGHADSVNTEEFNLKLSEKRIQSVKSYLEKRIKAEFVLKEWPHGETMPAVPNNSEENMAKNRRVEIYLVAKKGEQLILQGDKQVVVEVPISLTINCAICESNTEIISYGNDREAREAGMSLMSASGRKLTTGGMVRLNFDCASPQSFPVIVHMPGKEDDCVSAWSTGNVDGQSNPANFDLVYVDSTASYNISEANYRPGTWLSVDKPEVDLCTHRMNVADDITVEKTKVYLQDSSIFLPDGDLVIPCGSETIFSWANSGGANYYYKGNWNQQIANTENTNNCDTTFTYQFGINDFTKVTESDTTLQVRAKGFDAINSIGYYLEELDLLVPLNNVKKTTYEGNYLNHEHTLRIQEGATNYDLSYNELKKKYKSGKKRLRITVKKKKLNLPEEG